MLNSIDYDQLNGQLKSNPNCGTKSTNLQMHKFKSINGKQLNPDDIAIPCGLMAYTYFNDTYSLHYRN